MSSIVGSLANMPIPVFMRSHLYGLYGGFFGVNMAEAVEEDYRKVINSHLLKRYIFKSV
jgi:phosphatidylserine decarboxylase